MITWLRRLWSAFSRWATGVSLQVKLVGIALGVAALLSLSLSWQFRTTLLRALSEELGREAIAAAGDVARRSAGTTGDLEGLRQAAQDQVAASTDVRYVILLDRDGAPLAHSFDPPPPADVLDAAVTLPVGQDPLVQRLQVGDQAMLEAVVAVDEGALGAVRVVVSLQRLTQVVTDLTRPILATAASITVLGMGVSAGMTLLLTRPLTNLIAAIRRVAAGDLTQRVVPWAGDEIGEVQASFNEMVERLADSHREMETANRSLTARTRELGALYAISRAIAGPMPLHEILERALREMMDLTLSSGGWICLLGMDDACEVCVTLGQTVQADLGAEACRRCTRCREAVRTRKPLVVTDLPPGCPIAELDSVVGHAIVPFLVKSQVVGLLNLVCCGEATIGAEDLGLLMDLGRQLGVAIENARLWEELQRKEALRGRLLRQVITAQETERRRISRELHDEAGQALTSILVGLRALDRADDVTRARALVADLRKVVTQTMDGMHDLALELRPSVLDDLGLVRALERQIQNCPARYGFQADFVATGIGDHRLPPEVETTLYRITQEALTNVARHAAARHVSVLLQRRRAAVALVIEDDGQGFDVAQAMQSSQGSERLGLYGIEERAALIGGSLTVESAAGTGTTVSVEIPLEEAWHTRRQETKQTRAR
jgi:signal transduction histidine kinase